MTISVPRGEQGVDSSCCSEFVPMKYDLPVAFLQKLLGDVERAVLDEAPSVRKHVHQVQCVFRQYDQIGIESWTNTPFSWELQNVGGVSRHHGKKFLERQLAHADAYLFQQSSGAVYGCIGRCRDACRIAVMVEIELQPFQQVMLHRIDIYGNAAP